MVVSAHDIDNQDLLSVLPLCIEFIKQSVDNVGTVLIHWYGIHSNFFGTITLLISILVELEYQDQLQLL